MPNHVTTTITVDATNADEIIESLRTKDSDFDFNVIAPRPPIMEGFEPCLSVIDRAKNAMGELAHTNELIGMMEHSNRVDSITTPCPEDDIDDVIRAIQCFKETGFFYWHDWNRNVWGTKWNSYSVSIEGNAITFDTAWSHPTEILLALSSKYPHAEFRCTYADEDLGANCGEINYQDGHIIHENVAPKYGDMTDAERTQWLEFAMIVKDYTAEQKKEYFDDIEE